MGTITFLQALGAGLFIAMLYVAWDNRPDRFS